MNDKHYKHKHYKLQLSQLKAHAEVILHNLNRLLEDMEEVQ